MAGDDEVIDETIEAVEPDSSAEGTEEVTEEETDEEDSDEGDEGDSEAEEAPKALTRGQARHQKLANETREAKEASRSALERMAVAEAQLAMLREQRQNGEREANTRESQRQEAEKLALMEPWEKTAYVSQQKAYEMEMKMHRMQLDMVDSGDKAAFHALKAVDPLYAKYADKVEESLGKMKAAGHNTARVELLKWHIGNDALAAQKASGSKVKAAAAKRVGSATSKPVSGRGEGAEPGRGKSAEQRLTGVEF